MFLAIDSIKSKSNDFRRVQMMSVAQIALLTCEEFPARRVVEFLDQTCKAASCAAPALARANSITCATNTWSRLLSPLRCR
jgi:hypothetical protein